MFMSRFISLFLTLGNQHALLKLMEEKRLKTHYDIKGSIIEGLRVNQNFRIRILYITFKQIHALTFLGENYTL